jgi:hypothetical protein
MGYIVLFMIYIGLFALIGLLICWGLTRGKAPLRLAATIAATLFIVGLCMIFVSFTTYLLENAT